MNPLASRPWTAVLPALLVALAYFGVGFVALALATTPSAAAPLFPSAGIALAAVLVYGARVLPGVALGAFALNATLALQPGTEGSFMLAVPVMIALGATAQAALGAWLVQRFVPRQLTLDEPRDIAKFFLLGGPLACLTSASAAMLALTWAGVVHAGTWSTAFWTWWSGDTMGVLIGAPIALTLIGRPRGQWVARQVTVGLPLLALALLLGLAMALIAHGDDERKRGIFGHDANAAAEALERRLREPLNALEALRGLFLGSDRVTADELRRASQSWLESPEHLVALGYAQRVARDDVARFESGVRAAGLPDFRVFDRPSGSPPITTSDSDLVVIRHIEPREANRTALGVNALSTPAARAAIERSARDDEPVASAGFRLTQANDGQVGVVIYRALYPGARAVAPSARREAMHGVVFATLRMDDALARVMSRAPDYLRACMVDTDAAAGHSWLAGPPGCDLAAAAELQYARQFELAGRHWKLSLTAQRGDVPDVRNTSQWLFASVGLLSAAMLGALLLTVTGRARRIEQAVTERTADLQHEVVERERAQVALQREIGERERTEAELRDNRQQLANILDYLPVGVRYTDLKGNLLQVNPAYCQMSGYTAEELEHRSIADLTHPDDQAGDRELFAAMALGQSQVYTREKRLVTKSGQIRWIRVASRLYGRAGDPEARSVGLVEDITDHVQLREAERARQAAEAANRAKSEFLSRMSHELRTPLNAMLGFAQLLELDDRPGLAAHQREWGQQIQHAGWHLLHMINDTLDLSRIEAGTLKLEMVAIDLQPLLGASVSMVEAHAAQRGIGISMALDPSVRAALGDTTRVKQIVTNLLSNAVKYNVDGGSIWLSARNGPEGTVEISVRDSGLGLNDSQMGALFQPFNRLGREQSRTEGTGIGLVISRRLAELMGGSLRVHSAEGQGSTFTLVLPRAAVALTEADSHGAMAPTQADYRRRVVHYIEDNETNAEVMRGILAQRPQIVLEVSSTGLDGLASIRSAPPSLVLLDMHLPDIDGLELLRHLRADAVVGGIPVVAVSADATTARIEQAFADGANEYVTKPVNVQGFLALLDRLLEEQSTLFG